MSDSHLTETPKRPFLIQFEISEQPTERGIIRQLILYRRDRSLTYDGPFKPITFNQYQNVKGIDSIFSILSAWHISDFVTHFKGNFTGPYKKQKFKAISLFLEMSPTSFLKKLRGMMFLAFAAPLEDPKVRTMALTRARGQPAFSGVLLKRLLENKQIIDQAAKDNLHSIIPALAFTGRDPKVCRELYGREVWRKICQNSLSRNKLIFFQICPKVVSAVHPKKNETDPNVVKKELFDIPSTLLVCISKSVGHASWLYFGASFYLRNNFKGKWSDYKLMNEKAREFRDTVNLLGDNVNLDAISKWTPRRLREEHDKAFRKALQRSHSDEAFPLVSILPERYVSDKHPGFTAKLLKSPFELAVEGNKMGHCVGSYSGLCKDSRYVVYSISNEDGVDATAGLHVEFKQEALTLKYSLTPILEGQVCKPSSKDRINVVVEQVQAKYNRPPGAGFMEFAQELAVYVSATANEHINNPEALNNPELLNKVFPQ